MWYISFSSQAMVDGLRQGSLVLLLLHSLVRSRSHMGRLKATRGHVYGPSHSLTQFECLSLLLGPLEKGRMPAKAISIPRTR